MGVKQAALEHLEVIQNLNQQIFDYEIETCDPRGWNRNYPYTEEGQKYLEKAINCEEGFEAFIYQDSSGEVVGYFILHETPEDGLYHRNGIKQIQFHTACVDREHRRKGIGGEMIDFAKAYSREKGYNSFRVVANANNKAACSFYKKAGFQDFEMAHELDLDG